MAWKITEPACAAGEFYYQHWMRYDLAPASAAGSAGGEQEAQGLETALPDSLDRPDSFGRAAGILQTPHRFRTKRQLWTYSGLASRHTAAPITVLSEAARTSEETDLRSRLNRTAITI